MLLSAARARGTTVDTLEVLTERDALKRREDLDHEERSLATIALGVLHESATRGDEQTRSRIDAATRLIENLIFLHCR